MKLSLGILAHNSASFIERLLQAAGGFADEIVIGVDRSSTDSTEDICARYADKLFRLEPIGTSERALAWLNDQCSGDWILRLDDDELPSTEVPIGSSRNNLSAYLAQMSSVESVLERSTPITISSANPPAACNSRSMNDAEL